MTTTTHHPFRGPLFMVVSTCSYVINDTLMKLATTGLPPSPQRQSCSTQQGNGPRGGAAAPLELSVKAHMV